jgi:hypothetical protein
LASSHVVFNPNGPDIEFEGELLIDETHATSGRITVYRTGAGHYVVEQVRHALRGNPALHRVEVVERPEDLPKILGDTPGGKNVLAKLGQRYRYRIS